MHKTGTIPDGMYGITNFYGYTCLLLAITYLFDDVVSNSAKAKSKYSIGKDLEEVIAQFKSSSLHLLGGTEDNHEKPENSLFRLEFETASPPVRQKRLKHGPTCSVQGA